MVISQLFPMALMGHHSSHQQNIAESSINKEGMLVICGYQRFFFFCKNPKSIMLV